MESIDNRPPRVGATLVLVATFALGMVAGGALLYMARLSMGGPPREGPAGRTPAEHLQRQLGLDPSQVRQLEKILDDGRGRMRSEADRTRDSIREILTPEQRERFDAMRPPPPPGLGPRPGPGRGPHAPPPRRPPPPA